MDEITGKSIVTSKIVIDYFFFFIASIIVIFYWFDVNIYLIFLLVAIISIFDLYRNFKLKYFGSLGLLATLFIMFLFSMWVYISPSQRNLHEAPIFPSRIIEQYGEKVIKAFAVSIASFIIANMFFLRKYIMRFKHLKSNSQHKGHYRIVRIIKKQGIVLARIFLIVIAILMLIDVGFRPTIITSTYNEYQTRLFKTPFFIYIHLIFPAFLLYLFLLADLGASKRRARRYIFVITVIFLFGLLTGSRSLFVFLFFILFFYYIIWDKSKIKYLKIILLTFLAYVLIIGIAYIRGYSLKEMQFSKYSYTDFVSLWSFPILTTAPYQTATCIELSESGHSLNGQSYRDFGRQIIPSYLADKLGIKRPLGGAATFTSYAISVGGLNMVGEAYWNLGVTGPIIVFFILGIIFGIFDKLASRYGWTGRSVSLYLLYSSYVGMGYGTSVLWRALQIALALLIFIHFLHVKRKILILSEGHNYIPVS